MTDPGQIKVLPVLLPGNRREPGNVVDMRFSDGRPVLRASSIALERKSKKAWISAIFLACGKKDPFFTRGLFFYLGKKAPGMDF